MFAGSRAIEVLSMRFASHGQITKILLSSLDLFGPKQPLISRFGLHLSQRIFIRINMYVALKYFNS